MKESEKQCPSAKGKPGALLLAVINATGQADILEHPVPVTEEFIAKARQGRSPEQRFRFANKCVESGCLQWTGSRCGVIDKVIEELNHLESEGGLPICDLRPRCRWYNQSGADACRVCPFVITESESENPQI